jgi:predicted small lipoprotein YifL
MRGPQIISPPLVGGVRACPVLDTGGGGSRRGFACLILAFMLLIPASCGRKGDPFLPQKSTNARVVDLEGAWQGGYIELKGGIADFDSTVTGARVHYAVYPVAESPCDGCPIEFQGFHSYGTEVIREDRFLCKIPGALRGNVYYFEVQLTGDKGSLGPPSNRAKVVVE